MLYLYGYNCFNTDHDNASIVPKAIAYTRKLRYFFYLKPHSHPNGFYWGHQCSWTLAPANSMQVSIMQFDNCNRK